MPLLFVRNDITKMQVDAIVNAANKTLLGGGGVDGSIHRAAGAKLLKQCLTLGGCKTGEAKRTDGFNLPCKYVIHTVGPVWHGGQRGEEELLSSCYRRSLEIAAASDCESVAFPLISAGVYGYPRAQALDVAVRTIQAFLQTHDMTVYMVLFDRESLQAAASKFGDVQAYINDRYVQQAELSDERYRASRPSPKRRTWGQYVPRETEDAACPTAAAFREETLDDLLQQLDESFAQMLFRKIDEKGMTDVQCYKRANIDRKLFSKIRSNPAYKPGKQTVIAFAVALELSLEETKEMLLKAGYALSHSSKFDIIIEFFIVHGKYDVTEINEALFAFDQKLLGA